MSFSIRTKSGRWGDTIKDVVTRPWQFEPWMTRRKEIGRLSPNDPRYQDAARIADAVLSGQMPDPTAGATHFLNPTIVRQRRGGSLPSWAQGEGQPIGQHTFYAPNGGVPTLELTAVVLDLLKEILYLLERRGWRRSECRFDDTRRRGRWARMIGELWQPSHAVLSSSHEGLSSIFGAC